MSLLDKEQIMAELQEIQYLTDEMLTCAQQGEWDLLADMEQTRSEKIVALFTPMQGHRELLTDTLQQWYEKLKQQDREITALCEVHKAELLKQMGQFKRSKQVSAAYAAS